MADTETGATIFAEGSSRASNPQSLLQSLLTTLRNMDFEYEREREQIESSARDAGMRLRMLERLREFHVERREPYVRQIAILQQRSLSDATQPSEA